jgi:hypothetical protein
LYADKQIAVGIIIVDGDLETRDKVDKETGSPTLCKGENVYIGENLLLKVGSYAQRSGIPSSWKT